jgi:hypothetical protein
MVADHVKPLDFGSDLKTAADQTIKALEDLDNAVDILNNANEDYFDALYDYSEINNEETEAGVQITAMALEAAWAEVQQKLSEYAVLMSIEGNEAFQRVMD